jgi:hypothetical protein
MRLRMAQAYDWFQNRIGEGGVAVVPQLLPVILEGLHRSLLLVGLRYCWRTRPSRLSRKSTAIADYSGEHKVQPAIRDGPSLRQFPFVTSPCRLTLATATHADSPSVDGPSGPMGREPSQKTSHPDAAGDLRTGQYYACVRLASCTAVRILLRFCTAV